jgi:integrase
VARYRLRLHIADRGTAEPPDRLDELEEAPQGRWVPERRLHDARHTAATVLLLLGVSQRAVMSVMGWSSTAMAARYQHVVDTVRTDIATRAEGLLWAPDDEANEGPGEPSTAA